MLFQKLRALNSIVRIQHVKNGKHLAINYSEIIVGNL